MRRRRKSIQRLTKGMEENCWKKPASRSSSRIKAQCAAALLWPSNQSWLLTPMRECGLWTLHGRPRSTHRQIVTESSLVRAFCSSFYVCVHCGNIAGTQGLFFEPESDWLTLKLRTCCILVTIETEQQCLNARPTWWQVFTSVKDREMSLTDRPPLTAMCIQVPREKIRYTYM